MSPASDQKDAQQQIFCVLCNVVNLGDFGVQSCKPSFLEQPTPQAILSRGSYFAIRCLALFPELLIGSQVFYAENGTGALCPL